jgi:hypothetical protein
VEHRADAAGLQPVHVEHVRTDRHRELRGLPQHIAQLAEHRQRHLAQHQPVHGQLADLEQPQPEPVTSGSGPLQHAAGGQAAGISPVPAWSRIGSS